MRLLVSLVTIIATAGCLNAENFQAEWISAECEWWQRCNILDGLGFESPADCVNEGTAAAEESAELGESCQNYDRDAAIECLDGLEEAECGEDMLEDYPEACLRACPAPE